MEYGISNICFFIYIPKVLLYWLLQVLNYGNTFTFLFLQHKEKVEEY